MISGKANEELDLSKRGKSKMSKIQIEIAHPHPPDQIHVSFTYRSGSGSSNLQYLWRSLGLSVSDGPSSSKSSFTSDVVLNLPDSSKDKGCAYKSNMSAILHVLKAKKLGFKSNAIDLNDIDIQK